MIYLFASRMGAILRLRVIQSLFIHGCLNAEGKNKT